MNFVMRKPSERPAVYGSGCEGVPEAKGLAGDVRLMGPIRRQAASAKSVTVGRAGEGPNWRGFCAAVTLRFSASSPELAGGGGGNQAI
jgi:hypothetical protein